MEEIVYYTELYDTYSSLLTDKQREAFEDYYFENLTLEEIASQNDVSKNAVSKQIKTVKSELDNYETKLNIVSKKKQILNLVEENLKDKIIEIFNQGE